MASFVKLFKRKASKQIPLSDPSNTTEMPSKSTLNTMRGDKQLRASLRINRKQSTRICDCGGLANDHKECGKSMEYCQYKSPYSVFTEPTVSRPTRSCPPGPSNNKENQQMRKIRKFSPPFGHQETIHERSDSYENFTASQSWEEKQSAREKQGKGHEGSRKVAEGDRMERLQQKTRQTKSEQRRTTDGILTDGMGSIAKRCRAVNSAAHCYHLQQSQRPLSTSEYCSADPSPISEKQPQLHHHARVSPRTLTNDGGGKRGRTAMTLIGLEVGEDEESSSEDGDNSSDDHGISPTALIQFWQQQVRMLKRELKAYRETAEKYRSKYLRLKTKTDELSSELTREKERNFWLFNQLIASNDKMTQLNWAHLHIRDSQRQHNLLTVNTTEIAENCYSDNYPFGTHLKDEQRKENCDCEQSDNCDENVQRRSTAGEIQAELSSDDFDDKTTAIREGNCAAGMTNFGDGIQKIESENGQQKICHQQQLKLRTPTLVPLESVGDVTNNAAAQKGKAFDGTPFLNFNLCPHVPSQLIRSQLHVEVARGSHLNGARNSNSRLISPPLKKDTQRETDNDNNSSSEIIEEDDDEQLDFEEEEEDDNESLLGTDSDEQCPIVIPLDAFCQQHEETANRSTRITKGKRGNERPMSVKLLLRHALSSGDIRDERLCKGKQRVIGSTMASSSEDDIRMWKKQLRSRGERVLFRPSRKSLFAGVIGDGKGPNKIFRRFAQPEREALAKFDYLRDEGTDVSGLMSSPEKMVDTKIE